MRKYLPPVAALCLSLLCGSAALAQGSAHSGTPCAPGHQTCSKTPERSAPKAAQKTQPGGAPGNAHKAAAASNHTQKASHGPQPGQNARSAPVFQQSRPSRLPAPPAHQEYRVIDGTVVRVDSNTLKVLAIVGLMQDLMK